MLKTDLREWEEYDAKLSDGPFVGLPALAAQRSGSELRQTSYETPGGVEGPFLLRDVGETASETEAERRGRSAHRTPKLRTSYAGPSLPGGDCDCGDPANDPATDESTEFEGSQESEAEAERRRRSVYRAPKFRTRYAGPSLPGGDCDCGDPANDPATDESTEFEGSQESEAEAERRRRSANRAPKLRARYAGPPPLVEDSDCGDRADESEALGELESEAAYGSERESLADGAESFEVDPYSAIRPALSPEHANLPAGEITLVLGHLPASLVLHQLLDTPAIRQATVASILGSAARRTVRVNGANVSIPAYLRMVSRLCGEVAGEGETEVTSELAGETGETEPEFEGQVLGPPTVPSRVLTDAQLKTQLSQIGTKAATAVAQAFAAFDKPAFLERLNTALSIVGLPTETGFKPFAIHLARLGAEAFVTGIGGRLRPGYTDDPHDLTAFVEISQQEAFLFYALRRLLELALTPGGPSARHSDQMDRAITLFKIIQGELGISSRGGYSVFSESMLVEQRSLLVQIIWLHYQALLEGAFLKSGSLSLTAFERALTTLRDQFQKAAVTGNANDIHSSVPLYRIAGLKYRDYFHASAATDVGFRFFSAATSPRTDGGPVISFRTIVQQRLEQLNSLRGLLAQAKPSSGIAVPGPPDLHDSLLWQKWIEGMWNATSTLPPDKRIAELVKILELVSGYFEAFTTHMPEALDVACSDSYLTRSFPRAITGGLVHDCKVYASRWIFMMGRLLAPGSFPHGLNKPRIFLIDMPSHTGMMIRAEKTPGVDVVLAFNNSTFAPPQEVGTAEPDEIAARLVVNGMFHSPLTPFCIRPVMANPTNAAVLWSQVCKLLLASPVLPYSDSSEPHMRFVRFNSREGNIGREAGIAITAHFFEFLTKVDPDRKGKVTIPHDRFESALADYRKQVTNVVNAASEKFKKDVLPLQHEIQVDIDANKARLPKGCCVLATTQLLRPWESGLINYRPVLDKAVRSMDLKALDPSTFFPESPDMGAE
jgi:hypothetical protein